MRKFLLAVLAVAALALVAVATIVVIENPPERRMDRRYDKLLRTYDDPKQLYQRLVDDRDLLGFALVHTFLKYKGFDHCSCTNTTSAEDWHNEDCDYPTYQKQCRELYAGFRTQIVAAFCDCGGPATLSISAHPEDCNFARARQDMYTTWGPYIRRKNKELLRKAWLNR